MMKNYNVTGDARKQLVEIISKVTGDRPVYTRMPECAYEIGSIKVSKTGELIWDESVPEDVIDTVTEALTAAGFTAEEGMEADENVQDSEDDIINSGSGQNTDEVGSDPADEPDSLSFSFPRADLTDTAITNLKALIASKAMLIRKALQADSLDIDISEDKITFPWWEHLPTSEQTNAYCVFLAALVKMAKEAKRVTAKEHPTESEKYTFRVFLLRLGFIGPEYKQIRAILMKSLSGHSAFKNKADADAFYARLKERRVAAAQAEQDTAESTVNMDLGDTIGSDNATEQDGGTEPDPTAMEAAVDTDITTTEHDVENAEEAADEISE